MDKPDAFDRAVDATLAGWRSGAFTWEWPGFREFARRYAVFLLWWSVFYGLAMLVSWLFF